MVTTAVRLPTAVGLVPNVTVSDVAVAAVTLPVAPSLSVTVLCAATGSKPWPLIVSETPLIAKAEVLLVTTGVTGHLDRRAAADAGGRRPMQSSFRPWARS